MRRLLLAVLLLAAAGCTRRPAPVAVSPHYVVGAGYQAGNTWYYPREDFHYDATGLASIEPAGRGLTADGEPADPTALTAAHQTLQLPSLARVTNLETGTQVLVRVNDRGPASPGRIIALSPRAASLLGVMPGGVARVRVQVEEGPSLALREQLNGGPRLQLAAVPRGAVTQEALAPPPGIGQSARGRAALTREPTRVDTAAEPEHVPDRLPEVVTHVAAEPGTLVLRAGSFGQASYAAQVQARLSGLGVRIERRREGRSERYDLVAGPYATVAAADAALEAAIHAGVGDARITVEQSW